MADYSVVMPAQVAAVLRGLRAERGLTQRQAGDKVGLLPKTISALETDPDRSTIASLFKLLSALDVELVLKTKSAAPTPRADPDW